MKILRIAKTTATEMLLTHRLRLVLLLGPLPLFLALALPAPDASTALRTAVVFTLRMAAVLTWIFAVAVAAQAGAYGRMTGGWALVASRPVSPAARFAGRALGAVFLVTLWWALLFLGAWAVVGVKSTARGAAPLRPVHRTFATETGKDGVLTSGDPPLRIRFESLSKDELPPGPLTAMARVHFRLKDPGSRVFGTPLTAWAVDPGTGQACPLDAVRSSLRSPVRVSIPRRFCSDGAVDLLLGLGPSPFQGRIREDSVWIEGRPGSLFRTFFTCGVNILLVGLALALFTAASVQFLSMPLAATLGGTIGFAGLAGGFVGRVARSLLSTLPGGPFAPSETQADLSWTGLEKLILTGIKGLTSLLPDLSSVVPAADVIRGYEVPGSVVGCTALAAGAVALAAFIAGSMGMARGSDAP